MFRMWQGAAAGDRPVMKSKVYSLQSAAAWGAGKNSCIAVPENGGTSKEEDILWLQVF